MHKTLSECLPALLITAAIAAPATAEPASSTAFTYRGELKKEGRPLSGSFDMELRLFDEPVEGKLLGKVSRRGIPALDGYFVVDLDFGISVSTCVKRWLEVGVRAPESGDFVTLAPRHALVSRAACTVLGDLQVTGRLIAGDGCSVGSDFASVGGGFGNSADGIYSRVGGGGSNRAAGEASTVGGGFDNDAGGNLSTVGGGTANEASGMRSTVGGGSGNDSYGDYSTVGGGESNLANADHSAVGGGWDNEASGMLSTVGGGGLNEATAANSTVGGGIANTASGEGATVPGGSYNKAKGNYSFAAGRYAVVDQYHHGTFLWADSSEFDFGSATSDAFQVRATGGTWIVSAIDPTFGTTTAGVHLAPGAGSWGSISDRALKDNFEAVDGRQVLDALVDMPVLTWNYIAQDPAIRHMGPTAQDFHAAFGLGGDERYITGIDGDGVAHAAIQGLFGLGEDRDARIQSLERENRELKARLSDLEKLVRDLLSRH
jgi:hypothetical protein